MLEEEKSKNEWGNEGLSRKKEYEIPGAKAVGKIIEYACSDNMKLLLVEMC